MRITELYIKNFGTFSERHFYLKNGVNVIYGENEFGKSTLHAFIRAMLFGMERGRGKAAAKDDFTRYEPWENPNYYAGVMRFSCGGRNFRLERSFDRFTKHASLICEDDGEELSVEHGDLEMLLGEVTPSVFDSTVSVGQLQASPGQDLAEALKNYAANYLETGGGEIDLSGALSALREKKRDTERACRQAREKREEKVRSLERECRYREQDMAGLSRTFEERKDRLQELQREREEYRRQLREVKAENDTGEETQAGSGMTAGGAAGVLIGLLGIAWARFLGGQDWFSRTAPLFLLSGIILVIGVMLLIFGIRSRWSERRNGPSSHGRKQGAGEAEKREEAAWIEKSLARCEAELQNIYGNMERIQEEWKEKQVRLANLREQAAEVEPDDAERSLMRQKEALELAEEKTEQAARTLGQQASASVNAKASEIFREITAGKYQRVNAGSRLELSAWDGERKIPAERLSRGTLEQIYLSVRIAAAELMQEEPLPLILDDTFAFYDDKRLKSALKWLSGQKRQVIILTCQKREAEILGTIR